MKSRKKEARRWFLQGQQDLEDARFNLSGKRYNVACFLAQQAAEKALKSFLIYKGAEEVWGHSLVDLTRDAEDFDPSFDVLESGSASLDKFYIPTRYPNALPGGIPSKAFDDFDAKRAISLAEKIIDFVKAKIGEL